MKGSGEEGKDTVIRSDSTLLLGTKGNMNSTLTPHLPRPSARVNPAHRSVAGDKPDVQTHPV